MKSLTLTMFILIFTASYCLAQENQAKVEQDGEGHLAKVTQTDLEDGDDVNEAYISQSGSVNGNTNEAEIIQDVDEGNFAKIEQVLSNFALIEQFADDRNIAVIKQDGDGNEAFITQGDVNGGYQPGIDENDAKIEQEGDGNRGDINQEGNSPAVGNFARVFQGTSNGTAVSNDADIQQNGSDNDARVWQGHNGTATENEADIDQTGMENIARVYQGHNGDDVLNNLSIIEQIGNSNDATIKIEDFTGFGSFGNFGEILQDGDFNDADLIQSGDENEAEINQSGLENLVDVEQTGAFNSAWVTQSGFQNVADVDQIGVSLSATIVQH